MSKAEYIEQIIEMLNDTDDMTMLRRIYLMLTVMIGG